jgi:hypothetical protein
VGPYSDEFRYSHLEKKLSIGTKNRLAFKEMLSYMMMASQLKKSSSLIGPATMPSGGFSVRPTKIVKCHFRKEYINSGSKKCI